MSIKGGISYSQLVGDGAIFDVNVRNIKDETKRTQEDIDYLENLSNIQNFEVAGEFLQDEDTYIEGQPFEIIASKMENLVGEGTIKKRVIRKGYGSKAEDLSIVRVHYNAYLEYNAEPFDSTYARKRPHQFSINNGEVIPGLDIAVQSMQLNEKSQFLIAPQFAYGVLGCLNRVPANSEVLFEIEVLEIIKAAAATTFQNLPPEEQKNFIRIYEYCLALCAKGKDLFGKNIRAAIREYNIAVGTLENAQLDDYDQQIKQQELLLKLYTNLLVCYTKIEEPKKACNNFNKIKQMSLGTDIKVSAKCYYNHAKCQRMLGDFDYARRQLIKALCLERKNPDILAELASLDAQRQNYKKKEKEMSKAIIGGCK